MKDKTRAIYVGAASLLANFLFTFPTYAISPSRIMCSTTSSKVGFEHWGMGKLYNGVLQVNESGKEILAGFSEELLEIAHGEYEFALERPATGLFPIRISYSETSSAFGHTFLISRDGSGIFVDYSRTESGVVKLHESGACRPY